MKKLKILPLVCVFLALFLSFGVAYGYEIVYKIQDNGANPALINNPSIYWEGDCTAKLYLYSSAGSSSFPYSLLNSYYSPNTNLVMTSSKTRNSNVTCQLQDAPATGSTPTASHFYETSVSTEYTSDNFNSWGLVIYDCDFDDNELFIYNGTTLTDSFGNHPFGYGKKFDTCFQQSPSQCSNTLTSDIQDIRDYINDAYYTNCSTTDLRIDAAGESHSVAGCGSIVSDLHMNYWIMIPFSSGANGIVNISVFGRNGERQPVSATLEYSNQYYIWDSTLNQTTNLGTTYPLSTVRNLIPNRDYWLFIGTRYYIDNYNCGSATFEVEHNSTDYNISIWAYEPDWICGEYGECIDNVQSRTCYDANGKVADKSEEKSCFEVPETDVDMGFEEYYTFSDNVYICQKQFLTCFDSLQTIDAKYPVGWSVVGEYDNLGINRANYIEVSEEFSKIGSRSLKMWYIPPKIDEPINNGAGGTVCGNLTAGRSPEINTAYNETLFLAYNVTFANPYAQIRYYVRKCDDVVLQYDYTGALLGFDCGKMCYAQDCNSSVSGEPLGKYGIRLTRKAGQLNEINENYDFYTTTGINETNNTIYYDAYYSVSSLTGTPIVINSSGNIFKNNTRIIFNGIKSNINNRYICISDGTKNITTPIKLTTAYANFTRTLTDLSNSINEIEIDYCNSSFAITINHFIAQNDINLTTEAIVFDYVDDSTTAWEEKIHDLSDIGLEVGVNYTLALSVNPINQFDPKTHCVYIDDIRLTFTGLPLTECNSYCDGTTFYYAHDDGYGCTFTIEPVSIHCFTNLDIISAIENLDSFEYDDELYFYDNESGEWISISLPDLTEEEIQSLSLYEPPEVIQELLISFGITQEDSGYIWFFFSLFMIVNYVAIGLGAGITIIFLGHNKENNYAIMSFITIVLIVIVSSTFGGYYPLEAGLPIIVGIGLMLWHTVSNMLGGGRN